MGYARKLLVLLFVFALVVAACGDDDESTTTAAPDEGGATTTQAAGEPTTTAAGSTETEAPPATGDILTDVGVDLEAGTISIGLLSDLSAGFAFLVGPIVQGHEVYWDYVNANGGINGLQVVPIARDTAYDVPTHIERYEELKDEVVAFGHSTGSPHTVAIYESLVEDGILAIPLTWYSGWTAPFDSHTMHHGTPYCIEAMNTLEYIVNTRGGESLAIAALPGDYGGDAGAGAKLAAEALGLEVVYEAVIIPGEDLTPIGNAIAESGADIVYTATIPPLFPPVYGAAIAQGFEATWSGAFPSYSPAYLTSDFSEQIARDWVGTVYLQPWSGQSAGNDLVRQLMGEAGAEPNDYYAEGFVEAQIIEAALRRAYDNGDMTQAGVLAAAKQLESVDFGGLAPPESYVGTPDERIQRVAYVYQPSLADLEAGGTGIEVIETDYTSDIAAGFTFESACFALES